jgi:AraC-like DNA-binding protein
LAIQHRDAFDWFLPTGASTVLGGLDLGALLSRAGIDPGTPRLSSDQHFLLMLSSIDLTDDECHGLGDRPLRPGFSEVGLRAMMSAATLEAALRVLARYYALSSQVFSLEVRAGDGLARIALRAEGRDRRRAAMLEEIWLMALFMFMNWFAGRGLPLAAMTVARPDHPDVGAAHWAFGAPVAVADVTSLTMPVEALQSPRRLVGGDEPIWDAIRFSLEGMATPAAARPMGGVFAGGDAPARVRLRDSLDGLALCERQVRRRVRQLHGASFRELRADALAEFARELLTAADEPVDAIAARLGYAEERSFRRFIRARTGLTPTQIRRGGGLPDHAARERLRDLARRLQA